MCLGDARGERRRGGLFPGGRRRRQRQGAVPAAAAAAEPRDRRWAPTRADEAAAEVEAACPRGGVRRRVHGGGRRVLPSRRRSRGGGAPGRPGRRRRPFRRVVLRRLRALDHGAEPVVRAGLSDELTIEHSRRNAGRPTPVSLFDRRQPPPQSQTGGRIRAHALPVGDRSPLNSFLHSTNHQINLTAYDRSGS